MGWLMFVIVMVAVIVIAYVRDNQWQTVVTGNGNGTGEVEAKYAFLRSNGIKCKIQSDTTPAGAFLHGGDKERPVVLKVHEKHVGRAEVLLEQYDRMYRRDE